MGCSNTDDLGMRYVYGELDEAQHQSFEAHMKECPECRETVEEALEMRTRLAPAKQLLQSSPEKADRAIIAAAEKMRAATPFFSLFTVFMKKSVATSLVFVLGFFAAGYLMYVASLESEESDPGSHASTAQAARANPNTDDGVHASASTGDSISLDTSKPVIESPLPAKERLGTLESDGVLPASGSGQ